MKPPFALAFTMSPWLVVLGAYIVFAGACVDDFCTALLREAAIAIVVLAAVVAGVSWYLVRRARGILRAGVAAWSVASGVAATVYAASQYYEGDVFPASMAIVLAFALLGFAWAASRLPRRGDPFAPRNAL